MSESSVNERKDDVRIVRIFQGNILSLIIINQSELGLKISFRRLISQLCVLDTICIIFSILMFSVPFHSEFYRLQVDKDL